jgi:DNA-binding NarL/FixJ family response regulator
VATPLIRIVVADQHAIDRGGLVGLIEGEPDLLVVGEAATVDQVVVQCRALKPDVLVMTMNLPDQDDEPALLRLRREAPEVRVLAMSDRGTHNCLVLNPPTRHRKTDQPVEYCSVGTDCLALAVTQGARATLRRNADPEDLFRGIRAVAMGQSWFDPQTTSGLVSVGDGARATPAGTGEPLSERELDVAALLAEGLSNKEISAALAISEPTVKKHVGHILEKLGLMDRLQAGLYIARHPLILRRSAPARPATEAPAPGRGTPPARGTRPKAH